MPYIVAAFALAISIFIACQVALLLHQMGVV
jgi:hypothetical protein